MLSFWAGNCSPHQAYLSVEVFASSCGHSWDNSPTNGQWWWISHFFWFWWSSHKSCAALAPEEYTPHFPELNSNEGFEILASNQVLGKSTGDSSDHFYDDRKGASVPQWIYLNSDVTYTPSPEAVPNHESHVDVFHLAHPSESPLLLPYHQADANKSDFGNSSSNLSSQSEIGSKTGWMKHYSSLVQYWNENGHCNLPQKYQDIENNLNLGVWVNKVSENILLT